MRRGKALRFPLFCSVKLIDRPVTLTLETPSPRVRKSDKSSYFFTCPFGMNLVKGYAAIRVVNVCI
jgi:hypothetical protein